SAKWSRRALALQNLKEVSVVGFRTVGISLLYGFGDLLANRSVPGAVRILPSQAILLARRADDLLSGLVHFVTFPWLKRVYLLSFYVAVADRNSIKLVRSDSSIEKFLASSLRIEGPFVFLFYKWYREGPFLVAYQQKRTIGILGIHGNPIFLARFCDEVGR